MFSNDANEALYRLEERTYGEVIGAVRASGALAVQKRMWMDDAMAVLCAAEDAATRGDAFDASYSARLDAIEESARSFQRT